MRLTLAYCPILFVLSILPAVPANAQEPKAADDPFADRAWHLELGSHYAIETWNYNSNHETMAGGVAGMSYGLKQGLALVVSAPLYYVDQRGTDAWLLGATWGVRWRVAGSGRVGLFVEAEVGVSRAESYTPPRGTRFNYLALGGAGLTMRVAPGTHLLTGLKWIHVSNSGFAGRDRNPDIEAVGPRIALLLRF
ncbi:MAG TPA: acyloxyacyl hydrolase [Vicinamibacterales bacterium]